MAIEKKSLIGKRATVKKAVLASNSNPAQLTSSPAVTTKISALPHKAPFKVAAGHKAPFKVAVGHKAPFKPVS